MRLLWAQLRWDEFGAEVGIYRVKPQDFLFQQVFLGLTAASWHRLIKLKSLQWAGNKHCKNCWRWLIWQQLSGYYVTHKLVERGAREGSRWRGIGERKGEKRTPVVLGHCVFDCLGTELEM